MAKYRYQNNAFWETDDKSILKCIRITEDGTNKKKSEVLSFRKTLGDGSPCPNYKEVVDQLGVETIDKSTEERKAKKAREESEKRSENERKKKAHQLEQLFNLKIKALEIEEIRESKDRVLRGKIRRAKNEVELNAYASILIAKELGLMK